MPAYDLLMLLILVCATILGAIKGFAWQVASIASIFASYFIAYYFRYDVAKMINAQPPWNLFLAMLVLYAGSSFLIWMVFRLVSGAIDKVRLKEFDRHMGALFGFGKGVAYCLLVTMFAMTLLGPKKQQAICESRSGYYISKILAGADGILPKEIDQVIGPHLARLEQKLEDGREGKFTDSPLNTDSWNLGGLIDSTKNQLGATASDSANSFGIPDPNTWGTNTWGQQTPPSLPTTGTTLRPQSLNPTQGFNSPGTGFSTPAHNLAIRPINSEIRHSRFNPTTLAIRDRPGRTLASKRCRKFPDSPMAAR